MDSYIQQHVFNKSLCDILNSKYFSACQERLGIIKVVRTNDELEEAVETAAPGTILQLNGGDYQLTKPLHIDKAITIKGIADKTSISYDQGEYVIKIISNDKVILQDVGIGHEGGGFIAACIICDSTVEINRCKFYGKGFNYQDIKRNKSFDRNLLNMPCDGLHITGQSKGGVTNCVFYNKKSGVFIGGTAYVILECNTTRESSAGVVFDDDAGGIARKNLCINSTTGIVVQGKAQSVLEGNTCTGGNFGIEYGDNASGLARGNVCINTRNSGILVNGNAKPILESNSCRGNTNNGIRYQHGASGIARQNVCKNNGEYGVYVFPEALPILEDNIFEDNKLGSIFGYRGFELTRGS